MSELSKHADRMREMAYEKRDFLMNHDPRLSPQVLTQHADDMKTLMAGAKAIERFNSAMLTLDERTQELLQSMQRVKELEQELAEARKDSERLTYMIEQANIGNGWLQDHVFEAAAMLCPLDYDEADDVQKWARAAINAAMEDTCEKK